MAALVTANLGAWKKVYGVNFAGPTKVADAVETDLSTPNTSIVFDTIGVKEIHCYMRFANYTGVTVKLQGSVDGTNYADITNATTATTATIITAIRGIRTNSTDDAGEKVGILRHQLVRLSIAGTLSGSADTLEVWVYMER